MNAAELGAVLDETDLALLGFDVDQLDETDADRLLDTAAALQATLGDLVGQLERKAGR